MRNNMRSDLGLTIPIFQGGQFRSTLRLREAQQQEAAINFQKTVLQAWHDVDNALTAYQAEQSRRDQLVQAVTDNQHAVVLAQSRYQQGRGGLPERAGCRTQPAGDAVAAGGQHDDGVFESGRFVQGAGRRMGDGYAGGKDGGYEVAEVSGADYLDCSMVTARIAGRRCSMGRTARVNSSCWWPARPSIPGTRTQSVRHRPLTEN